MKIEDVIKKLANEPVEIKKPLFSPALSTTIFIIFCLIVFFIADFFFNLNFYRILQFSFFEILELVLLLLFVVSSAYLTYKSGIPGSLTRREKYLPLLFLTLWLLTTVFLHFDEKNYFYPDHPGYACAVFLIFSTLLLLPLPIFNLKFRICTLPNYTGITLVLTTLGVSLFVLRIICPNCHLGHFSFWHVLPGCILGLVLLPIWRKVFKF